MSSQHERMGAVNSYIECECGGPQHIIRLTVDGSEEDKWEPTLSVDVQLAQGSFWFRLRNAFFYVFLSDLAQWDGSMLGPESVEQIERVFADFKRVHRLWRLRKQRVCVHCEGKGGVSSCNKCGMCASCRGVNEHKSGCILGHGSLFI